MTASKQTKDKLDNSGRFFDHIIKKYHLVTDAELAAWFGLARSGVSRVRNGKAPVSLEMRLAAINNGMEAKEVERLIGTPSNAAVKRKEQAERLELRQRIKVARMGLRQMRVTVANLEAAEKLVKAAGL